MPRQLQTPLKRQITYPDSDVEDISSSTLQWGSSRAIKDGMEKLFRKDPNVFVAGNLLWYPIEGDNKTRIGPDVLVAFGRPKGYRGSYKQWEEGGIPPQVAFEILSPGNRSQEMDRKFRFYEKYGVEEYYIYDPDNLEFVGHIREGEVLAEIPEMNGWVSPRMKLRFESEPESQFRLFEPDGTPFATYLELVDKAEKAEQERTQARQERDEAKRRAENLRRECESWESIQMRSIEAEETCRH
ncbi:MAG: Uma2 family endonuclease [Planctomycetota bacterium]|nr:Uma2 family endonuclease [Planctomycetota bacterium]